MLSGMYANNQFSTEISEKIFDHFDVNKDGVMDYKEYNNFMDSFDNDPNVIYKIAGLEDTGIKKLVKTEWDAELQSALKAIPPELAE
mmetsp:Transcript_48626/g.41079  ORF Transcript_48626/g.41079 Transcript_48626/m.41079 type:complete len:87 (-) Transcript_48626:223-483(-)